MTISIHGKVLELPNRKKISLRAEPLQVVEIGDVIVVRLRVPKGLIMNENVEGVDRKSGKVLWRIPVRKYVYKDSPYTAISQDGPYVWAHNWDGADVKIDPQTGAIVEEKINR